MSAEIIPAGDCCNSCEDEIVTQVPGPTGPAGTNGTNGTDGVNPFTVLTDDFQMPNIDAAQSARVEDTSWMWVGQVIAMDGAGSGVDSSSQTGYLLVSAITDGTHVELVNPNALASLNATPGDFVNNGNAVGPAGGRGPTGASGGGATLNSLSPTTSKGDLILDNGANNPAASNVRFAVGADGKVLTAASGQPTGVAWSDIDLTGVSTSLSGALPIAKGGTGAATQQLALNALAPPTPLVGDLLYNNGTNWVSLPKGTALQLLRVNAAANALEYASIGTGGLIQSLQVSTAAATVITTQIPYDNTIPQIGEGTQLLTVSLTPSSIASKVFVQCLVEFSSDSNDDVVLALFNGATPAIAAQGLAAISTVATQISLIHQYTPGIVTPIAFSIRMGSQGSSNLTINGEASARMLGGVQRAWMIVQEIV